MDIALVAVGCVVVFLALVLALKHFRRNWELSRAVQHLTGRQRRELTGHFLRGSQIPSELSPDAPGLARLYRTQHLAVLLNLGLVIGLIGQLVGPLEDDGPWRLLAGVAAAAGIAGAVLAARQVLAGRRYLSRSDHLPG